MATVGKWIPWALLAVGLGWGAWEARAARIARQRAGEAALAASNEVARNDSSHRVLLRRVVEVLGDSVQAVQRRVVQVLQKADDLDKALKLDRIAVATLTATVATLTTAVHAPPAHDSGGTRIAEVTHRAVPFTIDARAELPPPPDSARWRFRVALDPIDLRLRLGCGRVDSFGIRPASVLLTGPTWAQLALGPAEQSPDLCPSPALAKPGVSRAKWFAIGGGTVAGLVELARLLFPKKTAP